ncbi:probable binding protein component of ABC sugar transporter [Oceanicola granulosus HTCC2516]|uniref:Probable sugar-binding periplasmic protein n=1 Tax=Oceanicola granulosus (strain ATCC BAA-861 / DSM 15982 / KCTC 12143 / HTCC2516) TaxID=314256 RepID=Q2CAM3_OCEGH|nr:ABC transporter substrate-binding protein [Oceanicola granulosus]EAR49729.1 probable binding protein component of ABC sugar transporter [Oceanicola granulosus HTCC2516]
MPIAIRKSGAILALLSGTAATGVAAEDVIVFHNWSSGPEVAALNILKEDFESKGHAWTDIAIPHDTGSNVSLLNLVTGGNPPNVFLESSPGFYRDLADMGLARPLTDWYEANGYPEHLPASVLSSITVDGEIMKVPTAIHIDGMVYYNMDVAEEVGVDPTSWTSLEDMFASFDAVREAGKVPLAIGAQQWQIGYLTHALAAAVAGPDFFNAIYGGEVDPAVIDSAEMRELLDWLRRFQEAADEGAVNRDWNVTTNMVITGDALMQIHGDWMKGEWLAAGKVAGEDFGCIQIPGAEAVSVTVDSWGLLGDQSETMDQAELDFAATVLDPAVQARFAAAKGSTPVRLDATGDIDACSQEVLAILEDAEHQVANPHSQVDADWQSSLWDVLFNYWSDPSMTADEAIEQMTSNYDLILG